MGREECHDDLNPLTIRRSDDSAERDARPQYELEDSLGTMPSSGATGVTSRFKLYKFVVVRC
jgi:hypothetical protein